MDAGGSGASAFLDNSTVPVFVSITKAAVARVSKAATGAAIAITRRNGVSNRDSRGMISRCLVGYRIGVFKADTLDFLKQDRPLRGAGRRADDHPPEGFALTALLHDGRHHTILAHGGRGVFCIVLDAEDADLDKRFRKAGGRRARRCRRLRTWGGGKCRVVRGIDRGGSPCNGVERACFNGVRRSRAIL